MAFIDELNFHIRAGRGGDGVVRWLHEKGKEFGGPAGGDGGKGGDVYAETVRDIHILSKYRHQKEFRAENGSPGEGVSRHGKNGADLFIKLPIGSVITNQETGEAVSLENEGEKVLLLRGGRGGFGNEHFKSSVNRQPRQWKPGLAGEEADFNVELQLFADVGFIGLPNAGKSSLLNALTRAGARVASYPFTTLDPNLGEFFGFVLADIPGLIEGAHAGKGLGFKFLRHVRRTKNLVHLVSFENEKPMAVYKIVRKELGKYNPELVEKPEIIVLSKSDVADEKKIAKVKKEFAKLKKPIFVISLFDDAAVKEFADKLVKILRKKK
jgi:GTP-binding protein